MKKFIFISNFIVVVGFLLWFINEPGWEPAIGLIAAIVGLCKKFPEPSNKAEDIPVSKPLVS